jgi:hypothetical protein
MHGAEWGYAQQSFPYFSSGGNLVAAALGGDVSILIRCTQHMGAVTLHIEPLVVNVGRVMVSVEGSWSSWLYNTVIGVLKPQIKSALEQAIENALRSSASAINASMEWLAVLVLAVMQAPSLSPGIAPSLSPGIAPSLSPGIGLTLTLTLTLAPSLSPGIGPLGLT